MPIFKTIYKLRLLVHQTSQYHYIRLCALKDKGPTFNDLFKKIQRVTETLNLNEYYLAIVDNNLLLENDQTLQSALKSSNTLEQQQLDIVLYHKSYNKDNLHMHIFSNSNGENNVPVIKPTVLRWTNPSVLPTSQDDNVIRKDSAVSLDEPLRKKQRVMSADHPRKLPEPLSSPTTNSTTLDNSMYHPLDIIRRPSTAPPPSLLLPYPSLDNNRKVKLPALSSITTTVNNICQQQQQTNTHNNNNIYPTSIISSLDSQLAPIITYQHHHHHHHQSHHSNHSHHSHQPPHNTLKRTRASISHLPSTPSSSNSTFLCEHVTDRGKLCGQTFRRSYDLSRHQTIHLENRPFCYCDRCGKKFTRMDALRRHERVQGHRSAIKHRSMSTPTVISQPKTTRSS